MMWGKAKKIQEEAHQCYKWNKDENAWSMEVVQRILRCENGAAGSPPFTRLENMLVYLRSSRLLSTPTS